MRNIIYLLFLIMLVFGGAFLAARYTGYFQSPGIVVEDERLEIKQKYLVANGILPLVVQANDQADAERLALKLYDICQAVAASETYGPMLVDVTEMTVEFTHPDLSDPEDGIFTTRIPMEAGACR